MEKTNNKINDQPLLYLFFLLSFPHLLFKFPKFTKLLYLYFTRINIIVKTTKLLPFYNIWHRKKE